MFQQLSSELLPHVDVFNLVDDSLIKEVIAQGKLTAAVSCRLLSHIRCAEQAGADRIMVTCSSVGPAVEAAQSFVSIPVVRVDQAMADQAVTRPSTIGVIATLPTTLAPTEDLIRRRGLALGKNVEIDALLCEGAFEALMSGDAATHDRLVREQLEQLMQRTNIIVLAQASMARVAEQIPESERKVPILSSPRLAIESLCIPFAKN